MTKLTTERLETIATWRETYGNGANVMIPAEEAQLMARQLLAYEQAAKNPVAFTEACEISNMNATGLYMRGFPDSKQGRNIPIYAAPVLPQQPEHEFKIGTSKNAWPYYVAQCPKCGWLGSSEDCLGDEESCDCPLCHADADEVDAETAFNVMLDAINELRASTAQPVIPEQIEPAAWRCDKEGTKGVVITVHKQVADSWILKGWKVTPLIEANQSQPVSEPCKLPDGWVMVPQQIFLDASDIESICSQCGDGHKSGYGDFTDGLLWVGDIQCDNGTIMHGLHISSSDYQEEGGLTLAEFKAPVQESE